MQVEQVSQWNVIGAAVQGISHQKVGLPCQDAQGFLVLPGGALVVAVADGAGSAERSDEGAQCAVETALQVLSEGLETAAPVDPDDLAGLLLTAFERARQALLELAEVAEASPRLFATTLTCAVVLDGHLAAGQVGDGSVVAAAEIDQPVVVTQIQRGEYANETNFLSQDDALDHLEIQVIEQPVMALAVMTDGLMRLALKMPSHEPHLPFFQPLFAFARSANEPIQAAEQLSAFLASDRVCARTDDDKSLVLAVRTAEDVPAVVDEASTGEAGEE